MRIVIGLTNIMPLFNNYLKFELFVNKSSLETEKLLKRKEIIELSFI